MSRNNALYGAAWVGTMALSWGTTFGDVLASYCVMIVNAVHPSDANLTLHAWILSCIVLTFFASYIGKVLVGIWGEAEAPKPEATIISDYYSETKRLGLNNDPNAYGSSWKDVR